MLPRIIFLVILAFGAAAGVRAELTIQCEFGGKRHPLSGVVNRQVCCLDDGKVVAVPPDAKWVVDGDLRANAAQVFWTPESSMFIRPSKVWEPNANQPYRVVIFLEHETERFGKKAESPFLREWPAGVSDSAVAVCGWLLDGRIAHAAAVAVPSTNRKVFYLSREFTLDPGEERGLGFVILWNGGHVVPPKSHFSAERAEQAFLAIQFDDSATLAQMVEKLSPDATDRQGVTLLQYAAAAGSVECICTLLRAGAHPGLHWKIGNPLLLAVDDHRLSAVDTLIAANVETVADSGAALHRAIARGWSDVALRLVATGKYLSALNDAGLTPAAAAIDAGMADVVSALLERGVRVDFNTDQNARVLITQAQAGHTAMVRFLLEHGVRPNVEAANLTPLIAGALYGDPEIATALLAKHVDPNQAAANGMTALMATTLNDSVEYARVLLGAGARPDLALADGTTALHLAAGSNATEVAKVLLQAGAKVNTPARDSSALVRALAVHARETAAVLAGAGARIDLRRSDAPALLERAIEYDLAPVVRQALTDGWDPNRPLDGSWTAGALAAACGASQCLAALGGHDMGAAVPEIAPAGELDARLRPVAIANPVDPRDVYAYAPEAEVMVEGIIDRDGSVRGAHFISTPLISLAAPAVAAFSAWRFNPPVQHGRPVATVVRVPIVFPSSADRAFEEWDVDVLPVPLKRESPEVSSTHALGEVMVQMIVNAEGVPEALRIVHTPDPALSEPVLKAVAKWRFKPARRGTNPVPIKIRVPIYFQ